MDIHNDELTDDMHGNTQNELTEKYALTEYLVIENTTIMTKMNTSQLTTRPAYDMRLIQKRVQFYMIQTENHP